jgi:hypothetical protein
MTASKSAWRKLCELFLSYDIHCLVLVVVLIKIENAFCSAISSVIGMCAFGDIPATLTTFINAELSLFHPSSNTQASCVNPQSISINL